MIDLDHETIALTRDPRGVATITLARPDKHNAMNATMMRELSTCFETLATDASTRVIVLAAQGKTFCAGGDLGWMKEQAALDREGKIAGATELASMLQTINLSPKITIARIQGNAFGGGLGLISVCDLAFSANDAQFGLTETRLGLIPATIGPFVAARLGSGFGRQVFFSGRLFNTDFGLRSGLLADAVPADLLDAAVENAVIEALKTAPGAVAKAKLLFRNLVGDIDQATVDTTIMALADCWESDETRKGLDAFFNKQSMPWALK